MAPKIKKPTGGEKRKKSYAPPRLIRYGDLKALTRGGSNTGTESASAGPKTRVVGDPG